MRRSLPVTVMIVVALAATACSGSAKHGPTAGSPLGTAKGGSTTSSTAFGSSSVPGQGSTTTTVASTTGNPGGTPPTTTAPTTTPTTEPVPGAPCLATSLQVTPTADNPQGNTQIETFTMSNRIKVACAMDGYPGVTPYVASNGGVNTSGPSAQLMTIPAKDGAIGGAARKVTLGPGQTAVFFLMWSTAGGSCRSYAGIAFNAPTTLPISISVMVDFPFELCGGVIDESVVLPAGTAA